MAAVQQFVLTSPPETCVQATGFGLPVAHMAYRIGENGHLYRADIPISLRGGLMIVDSAGFHGRGDPSQLCREIIRECTARKFDGILCDFDTPATPFLEKTVAQLGTLTTQRGWTLYTAEDYANAYEQSIVLIPTALARGSLERRLRDAVQRYGLNRVALAVQRTSLEYILPSGAEDGRPLERSELAEWIRRFSPAIFFDSNLCAHYFTYMEQGTAHFVLFDDSGSLLRKAHLARELGIRRVFFTYPEVSDILPQLLME